MSVKILSIESGSDVCSVVLSLDLEIIAIKEVVGSRAHAAHLPMNIDTILKENKLCVADLDAIAVSEGPGSYTGLRIGVSTAKGLCYASGIPMLAISSLQAIAVNAQNRWNEQEQSGTETREQPLYLCPMLDARRMEVYTASYAWDLSRINNVTALVLGPDSFEDILKQGKVIFCGNGALKTEALIQHPNAIFMEGCISARGMVPLALDAYRCKAFANIAYFEPFYLKEFVALQSTKNLF